MSDLDQRDPRLFVPSKGRVGPRGGAVAFWLWLVTAALLLAVIGFAAYRVWPILHPAVAELAIANPPCDLLSSACVASFRNGGRVRLDITPRGIPVSTPLELSVELAGIDGSAVQVDFVGVDMDMGFNRMSLESSAPGRFGGAGMLPVCVRARMLWEARVLIETPSGLWVAPFRFETRR